MPATQCSKRADPVPMSINKLQKNSLRAVRVGEYKLAGSTLFFKGDPVPEAPEGFQVVIKDAVPRKSRDGELRTATECFRNAKVTQEYGVEVPGIAGLSVTNSGMQTNVKTFGFHMSEVGKFELRHAESFQKPSAPDDLFKSAEETFFIERGPNDIEVRTRGRGTHGTYYLSTYLRKVK